MSYRSYLFVPGDSARKMAKAASSGADALILDMEDAVLREHKPEARRLVAEFLAQQIAPARLVRVNALPSGEAEADIAATVAAAPEGYVLPKCEGPDDIEALSRMIEAAGGGQDITIMAIGTETVRGLRRLMREDWAHPRLTALTWGGEDLAADMGAMANRDASGQYLSTFRLARDTALLAAIEAGAAPVDSVFTSFQDSEGLKAETRAASALGFTGKMAIHPAQIAPINAAFTPGEEQIAWAREVQARMAAAESGVAWLDGEMLDAPHLRRAGNILALAARASTEA